MEPVQLSKRLNEVAKYVKKEARVADIGSDHAYLPCALVEQGTISFAVAGEVVKGPFERAQQEVRSRGLEEKIEVRLGDGLEVVQKEDKINTVTICGMGGLLIRDILQRGKKQGKIDGSEALILQPNVGEEALRSYLKEISYRIVDERIIEENKKIYEIIVAEPSDERVNYSAEELRYGPFLIKEKSDLFKKKWAQEIQKLTYIKSQLEQSNQDQSEKISELSQQMKEIQELIK